MMERDKRSRIAALIASLTPVEACVLNLYLESMPIKEIADQIGYTCDGASAVMHRIRGKYEDCGLTSPRRCAARSDVGKARTMKPRRAAARS